MLSPVRPPFSREFPADFLWGCATSSYQIEGGTADGGRGESIWDRFCRQPGAIRDGSSGEPACDHYHRWEEDLDLAAALGVRAYRFSIAWPRIFPNGIGSRPNPEGLAFYSRLVDGMLKRGLQPWATLYHWDLPQALQERGGWLNRSTIGAFSDFARVMGDQLGDRVQHWITHNEPWCTAMLGHHLGVHAPGLRDFRAAMQVSHHLLVSHGEAVRALRSAAPSAKVGITLSLHPIRPASNRPADLAAAVRHDGLRNRWFLDPLFGKGYPDDVLSALGEEAPRIVDGDLCRIASPCDFLGVNYYFPETVADAPEGGALRTQVIESGDGPHTAMGWPVDAQGMVELLERVQRDYAPPALYLTENGACYEDVMGQDGRVTDLQRQRFLADHIAAAHQALRVGVPLKGYFVWSLLDNFEWAEGYGKRFGLVHVDYATQQRRLKASGEWLRSFLRTERVMS
ncbi:GH1 family beta-glucosidase [Paucibacter sp. APW11]|uniref:Beta-glucosidase n=1 Tax=Roseateles aquae TaxID=3077235 RepID=A0ABU3PG54_9BURK|nr:GH1 family beta-glucosidase [Paucibacter sp. APW11]MDT9001566.1 GH1 family beta-glucosidase [Paucibacter sp. APW11]